MKFKRVHFRKIEWNFVPFTVQFSKFSICCECTSSLFLKFSPNFPNETVCKEVFFFLVCFSGRNFSGIFTRSSPIPFFDSLSSNSSFLNAVIDWSSFLFRFFCPQSDSKLHVQCLFKNLSHKRENCKKKYLILIFIFWHVKNQLPLQFKVPYYHLINNSVLLYCFYWLERHTILLLVLWEAFVYFVQFETQKKNYNGFFLIFLVSFNL